MTGITLILVLALMGGLIAYLGDKLGSKIGKKRLRLFGLRPHDTSVVMTIVSGILVATLTITVLTIASKEVRTALFGMEKMRAEIASLTATRDKANVPKSKNWTGKSAKPPRLRNRPASSRPRRKSR